MNAVLSIAGGFFFLISAVAYLFVRLRLRPKDDSEDYYYEFDDQQPGVATYEKWSRITFAGVAIGVLLLFMAVFI
jgi:Ca2+/Na+ antiporter